MQHAVSGEHPATSEPKAAFDTLYAGVIYDAMRFDLNVTHPFVVDHSIKPSWPMATRQVVFGPAFTCKGQRVSHPDHIDDAVRIRMFEQFTPGCVQVIDTSGDSTVAHFGDISGKIARKFGAVGAVIDGFTRDVRLLQEDGFPVFCRGVQPIDAFGRWQIVEYQKPVHLAGPEGPVTVNPGDCVFGDPDGVLIIPGHQVHEVHRLAHQRLKREELVRHELAGTDDIQSLYDRIGRW